MKFSRPTIICAVNVLVNRLGTHAGLGQFLLAFGLEAVAPQELGGLEKRATALIQHIVTNPDAKGPTGADLDLEIVEKLVGDIHAGLSNSYFSTQTIEETFPELVNSLRRDGYEVVDGQILAQLPVTAAVNQAGDEVHQLLEEFGFAVPRGHLDQAIAAHARGDWAAANAQMRTFVEGLLDAIALQLAPTDAASRGSSHGRRELLAQLAPPFILPALNEWVIGNNGGFIRGFWDRLHPSGSHPGLSDEEDSTFRLQLVTLVSHHLLRRLKRRISGVSTTS